LEIELVQPNPDRKPNHLALSEPSPAGDRRLRDLLDELATRVGVWLIHLGNPVMPLTRQLASRLDTWTILTGCDEAAIVAAYQMLKKLMPPAPGSAAPGTPGTPGTRGTRGSADDAASHPKRVQLMFMGCDADDADHAADRIRRAAERFLHVPIVTIGSRRQMQPVLKRRVGAFTHSPDTDQPHWQVLGEFIDDLRTTNCDPRSEISDLKSEIPDLKSQISDLKSEIPDPQPQPTPACPQAASLKPRAAPPDPIEDRTSKIEDLTSFIDDLHSLDARCPLHPAIQLAIDAAGRLHVLAHAEGKAIRPAIADLFAAAAWAQQNAALLSSPAPTDPPPGAGIPGAGVHLFVDQPKVVADFVATSAVHLHLLLPITVADRTTWHHVELN
jgi:hypothetical protein